MNTQIARKYEAEITSLEQEGWALIDAGELEKVKWLTDQIPREVLHNEPLLLHLRGVAVTYLGAVSEGILYQDRAARIFQACENRIGLAGVLTHRSIAYKLQGKYKMALADAKDALYLIENNDDRKSLAVRAKALMAKSTTLYHLGNLAEALTDGIMALDLYSFLGRYQDVAKMNLDIGMYSASSGQYSLALRKYRESLEYWQKMNSAFWLAQTNNNMAMVHYLTGDYVQAIKYFEQSVKFARKAGNERFEATALAGLGDTYAMFDHKAARRAFVFAGQVSKHCNENFMLFYSKYAASKLARQRKDFFAARSLLDQAKPLAKQSDYYQGLCSLEEGHLNLAQGDLDVSLDMFTNAAELLKGQPLEVIQTQVEIAKVNQLKGIEDTALVNLKSAFSMVMGFDDDYSLTVAMSGAGQLLTQFKNHPLVGIYATNILNRLSALKSELVKLPRKIRNNTIDPIVPITPANMRISVLGQPQVKLNGKILYDKRWTKMARNMFFALLGEPNGLTRSMLMLMFWPDMSEKNAAARLSATIYKIKATFGDLDLIGFEPNTDRYFVKRNFDHEVDQEMFDLALEIANNANNDDDKTAALQKATEVYGGPYLENITHTWVLPTRQKYEHNFFQAYIGLIEQKLSQQKFKQALADCKEVLSHAPHLELAHRLAMIAQAEVGNNAGAAKQYVECEAILKNELSVTPSPQTKNLYRSLIH